MIDPTILDSSQQAVTVVKPAGNEGMYKSCTCRNGELAMEGTDLVERCLADVLHMNFQLATEMNSEIANCKLHHNWWVSLILLCVARPQSLAATHSSSVLDIYPMLIEPTITWVPLGFSGYTWLDTKIVFKKMYNEYIKLCHLRASVHAEGTTPHGVSNQCCPGLCMRV